MKPVLIALSMFSVCLPYAGADIRNEPPIPSRPEYAKTIEAAIRLELKKPTGELTKADLDKVVSLNLNHTIMTDVGLKELPKLKQLTLLNLNDTKVTKAGVAQLRLGFASLFFPKPTIPFSLALLRFAGI